MKISARMKHIEKALQDQINIPNSERIIVVYPDDTEAMKGCKMKALYEKLKRDYGERVTQKDIITLRVVYDQQEKGE